MYIYQCRYYHSWTMKWNLPPQSTRIKWWKRFEIRCDEEATYNKLLTFGVPYGKETIPPFPGFQQKEEGSSVILYSIQITNLPLGITKDQVLKIFKYHTKVELQEYPHSHGRRCKEGMILKFITGQEEEALLGYKIQPRTNFVPAEMLNTSSIHMI